MSDCSLKLKCNLAAILWQRQAEWINDDDHDAEALLSVLTTTVYMNYCILLAETTMTFNVAFLE